MFLRVLALASGMLIAAACGSGEDGGGGGAGGHAGTGGGDAAGGAAGASGGGGGGAPLQPPCPDEQPTHQSACDDDGVECSFGTSIQPACRVTAKCENAAWNVVVPTCPPQGAGCPPSEPTDGVLCSDLTAYCSYLSGTICRCSDCPPGPPCPPPTQALWYCAGPPEDAKCPPIAPNVGSACNVSETTECRYGSCATEGPYVASCREGAWVWTLEACPL
jgi:hypothetical protein